MGSLWLPFYYERKVDILNLNNFIQQFQQNIIYDKSGLKQGCISLKPLEYYLPNGINRKSCIHITGDEEVGKTSLGLEFAYRNPDYIFIYIDTYFKVKKEDVPDNVYLFRTNRIEDIINYLGELKNLSADYIIIDSISNLLLPIEQGSHQQYVTQRYSYFNNAMRRIIQMCCKLNICLILFNTLNGNGKPSNLSSQILYQCTMSIVILEKILDGKNYWLNLRADKWLTRADEDSNCTILLTGKGGY
jgi:hypothetical protein